ncbi:hypothetical protein MTR_7g055927 [Medicago truncatula]|uniref:Uncharacterized protein n=1 Tax=Medicago truncatula TaxID=3880 RepID=A0A072U0B1_MEDTR|nr:hypothetical protein MTR_7g055927 [Medicago truncatula]
MDYFPMDIVNQISALLNPSNSDGLDTIGWGGTNTHQFTVQSAYNLQQETSLVVGGSESLTTSVKKSDWR